LPITSLLMFDNDTISWLLSSLMGIGGELGL